MAKKKKSSSGGEGCAQMAYKPPSPKQQIKYAAENVARTAVENHPKMKRMRDEITRAVEGAVRKHLGGGAKKGSLE